jgi:hypothetical protein
MKPTCRRVGTKGHENVIPAKAGIQSIRELDSRLHGNDGLEVFSGESERVLKDDKVLQNPDIFNSLFFAVTGSMVLRRVIANITNTANTNNNTTTTN